MFLFKKKIHKQDKVQKYPDFIECDICHLVTKEYYFMCAKCNKKVCKICMDTRHNCEDTNVISDILRFMK